MCHPTPENTVTWAIAAVTFFGFFQLGELLLTSGGEFNPAIHISWGDVSIDDQTHPTMAQTHLKKSKCDQLGRGADIFVGKTKSKVCPVLPGYPKLRGSQEETPTWPILPQPIRQTSHQVGIYH